jgi:hypothetical protein
MDAQDYTKEGVPIPHELEVAHYHGDLLRLLFIIIAVLIMLMQFTGNGLPMSPQTLLLFIATLAITAGITNPVQQMIHWFNLALSFTGLVIFGSIAIARLHTLRDFFTHDGIAGVIAFLFLVSLYLATRTVRAIVTGSNPVVASRK